MSANKAGSYIFSLRFLGIKNELVGRFVCLDPFDCVCYEASPDRAFQRR